jgi:CBS domain-containing protein
MLVSNLMNSNVITVSPDTNAAEAARLLSHYDIGSLPVTLPDGKLKGIITDRDIVLRCVAGDGEPYQTNISDLMTRNVVTISPDADIKEAVSLMASEKIRRLPVTKQGKLVGIIALADIAKARTCDMEACIALSKISTNGKRKP